MVRVTKKLYRRLLIGALIVLIAFGALAYHYRNPARLVDVPLTSIQEQSDVTILYNGLTTTIREMHTLPLVTIQFWVHVGAKDEPKGYEGIAHIFEHIWFKGTPTQPVGSFHKKLESLGGELNAMTSYDWTMFYVTVPSDKFDDIFPNMVDLLLNPSFNETEIQKEKQVILEEQRTDFNEPERYTDTELALLLIDKHPYRNPIIGYKDTIPKANKEEISKFYRTWYVPNNMNILIAGDVNKEEILQKIKDALGHLEPKELPEITRPTETPTKEPKYNSSYKDIGYNYIEVGFLAPKATDEDRYAMRVLQTILAVGDSSRVEQIVKKQKNLIAKAYSGYAPMNELGVIGVLIVTDPEKAGQAKAELLMQLNRFKTEQVTDEELERAKMTIRTTKVKEQEEIFQIGFNIGQAWIDDVDYTEYMNKINAVSKEDIRQAAQKYFTAYTMYELKPKL